MVLVSPPLPAIISHEGAKSKLISSRHRSSVAGGSSDSTGDCEDDGGNDSSTSSCFSESLVLDITEESLFISGVERIQMFQIMFMTPCLMLA